MSSPAVTAWKSLTGRAFEDASRQANADNFIMKCIPTHVQHVHEWLARGDAVSFIFTDDAEKCHRWYSLRVSSFRRWGRAGLLPSRYLVNVVGVTGVPACTGRNLLAERSPTSSGPSEGQLLQRLKQLYGEA